MIRTTLIAALGVLMVAGGALAQDRPTIESMTPRDGDAGVDVGLEQIEVTFDRPMINAFSWVGSGPLYPYDETRPPEWQGTRTAVLPVALKPDHDYQLWLNKGRFTWFRSFDGRMLLPTPLRFTTRQLPTLDAEANRATIGQLRQLLRERYSHVDVRSVDWDAVFADRWADLEGSTNALQFAIATAGLLEAAGDVHVTVQLNDFTLPTHEPTPFTNFDRHIVAAELPELEQLSDVVSIGRTADQTGYLLITTWDAQRRVEVLAALQGLRMLADAPGLIVDVRPNTGGSEELAREIAACFIDEPLVYAMHRFRDPDAPGGWTEPQQRVVMPRAEGALYRGPVVVLMGEGCMSSNEAFLMMMGANERVWLVGQPSYGASGNPKAHPLDNGVVVSLPSWQAMTADGAPFEGSGLEPDVLAMRDIDLETRSDWFIKVARRELETLKQRVREMEEGIR
jgi:hypothetical protein